MHFPGSKKLFDDASQQLLGGKAMGLFQLCEEGLNVPDFFVIPGDYLNDLIGTQLSALSLDDARRNIKTFNFPVDFQKRFSDTLSEYHFENRKLAVRSSGKNEDSSQSSFAGIYTSCLNVPLSELENAIKEVWASAWSAEAAIYQESEEQVKVMSVIVQEMVEPITSGVAFGIDPVSGDRKARLITAVWGLGEGLVSGELEADRYFWKQGAYTTQLVKKTQARVADGLGGANLVDVPAERQLIPTLQQTEIVEIVRVLDLLFVKTGYYQDLEFALNEEGVVFLQARPISTRQLTKDAGGLLTIWDNANILESYPGLISPLTFSIVSNTYEHGYLQLANLLVLGAGRSREVVEANRVHFKNMIGLIEGRLYYNLMTYYRLLMMLPGFKYTSRFIETALGVKEPFDLPQDYPASKWEEAWRLFRLTITLIWNLFRLSGMIARFETWYNAVHQKYTSQRFDDLNVTELVQLYSKQEREIIGNWKAPVINGFYTMIFFSIIKSVIKKWGVSDNPNFQNDLLIGEGNVVSTIPVVWTQKLANQIKDNPSARVYFENHSSNEIWLRLKAGYWPNIFTEINHFLRDFGLRTIGGELKMETIPYKDAPEKYIKILQSYLKGDTQLTRPETGGDLQEETSQQIAQALKGKPLRRWIFVRLVRLIRTLVRNRENTRYTRTRAFSIARDIFLAIGRKFSAEGILAKPRDILFLGKEEIFDFVHGTSINKDLQCLVDKRKENYEYYEKRIPNGHFTTREIVYVHNDFFAKTSQQNVITEDGTKVLQGTACCSGIVRGRARVITQVEALEHLDGDILVTYSTDPGWVKFFPTASAVVMQRGSLLSHTSIVAREMGIPSVIAVPDLVNEINEGDLIEVDGGQGTVKVIVTSEAEPT